MNIKKTVYNSRLRDPWSYIVVCGGRSATFDSSEKAKVGEWIKAIWESQEDGIFNPYLPAFVYYKWDYESNGSLYCKYERA